MLLLKQCRIHKAQ